MVARYPAIGRFTSLTQPRIRNKISFQARHASSSSNSPSNRARNLVYGTGALLATTLGYFYITDTRASVHRYVAVPAIRTLFPDAEEAHHFGTALLKELWTLGLYPRERKSDLQDSKLATEVFGQLLPNPIGISGGLDKHADIPDALFALGPSVVEIGGVTPLPQGGNAKPRVFRLASQNALINRYGLNSEGADAVAMRLRQRVRKYAYQHGFGIDEVGEGIVLNGAAGVPPGSLVPGRLLAVQIAKNKLTPDHDLDAVVKDHVVCVEKLGKYADIITVNVSSPNTPGLRALQSQGPLTKILSAVVDAANATDRKIKPAVMVKISPDEDSDSQVQGIVDAVWASGVSGVIVGNTTMKRPDPVPAGYELPEKDARTLLETGGYSGPQLFERTKQLVAKYRKALDGGPSEDISPPSNSTATTPPQPKKAPSPTDAKVIQQIEASTVRDLKYLKPMDEVSAAGQGSRGREIGTGIDLPSSSSENQPLIQLPERHSPFSSASSSNPDNVTPPVAISTQSASNSTAPFTSDSSFRNDTSGRSKALGSSPKVIFASGGITNGEQALEVLNAGASVAMCYTAVVYGGVGTVSRIKAEMRDEITAQAKR
jgi:dihydroorotate dehydrogenase